MDDIYRRTGPARRASRDCLFISHLSDMFSPPADRALCARLLFALAAERLSGYYARHAWVDDARADQVAQAWIARQRAAVPSRSRRAVVALSDRLARLLANSLSHQAGLHTAHEMMEALDTRYHSLTAARMLDQCDSLLRENGLDAD